MNSLGNSIDALIENIQVSEHHAENQRKLLKKRETEIKQIKVQLLSINEEREKNKEEIKVMTLEATEKEALVISLEKEIKILSNIQKEMKELHDKEEKILNEKQQNVWKDRESFCDLYHKISEEIGSMGTSLVWKHDFFPNIKRSTPELEDEENELFNSINKLEDDIQVAKKKVSEAELKLTELKLIKEKLTRDPDFGEEFIQLQLQLKQIQSEIENLENQAEHAKEQPQSHQLLSRKWKQQTLDLMPCLDNTTTLKPFQKENLENATNKKFTQKQLNSGSHWENDNSSTKLPNGLKRPVASVLPAAIENNAEGNYFPPKSNQSSKFVPKIKSCIGKKYLSRSNNWIQLQNELTDLLKRDPGK